MSDANELNFEPVTPTNTQTESQTMNDIIELTVTNGQPTTTSLAIAERFDKRHDNVLQSIERLECSKEFYLLNFQEVTHKYVNGKGAVQTGKAYNITKDGFMFLAMGFTGKEAAAWKERFIAAFNAMERQLLENAAAQQIPQPGAQLFLSHTADIMVAADRTFRAGVRSGRQLGLSTAQSIRYANDLAHQKTGINLMDELHAGDSVAAMEAGEGVPHQKHGAFNRFHSVERFLMEWSLLKLVGNGGAAVPFCPCSGSGLYQTYTKWCHTMGECPLSIQQMVGFAARKPGWQAGAPVHSWTTPTNPVSKVRKMVIPSHRDMEAAAGLCKTGQQHMLKRERFDAKGCWYATCYFAFEGAVGSAGVVAG